jgi:nitrile hydratase
MNGVHDMGGMQDMGPIRTEKNEPVFHEAWEGRVYAMSTALGRWGKWNIDASRHGIELIPPADYLRMSYYERWLMRTTNLLVSRGLLTEPELDSGKASPGSPRLTPALTAADVPGVAGRRGRYMRADTNVKARFRVGQRVVARNMNPTCHTRLPRYARAKHGVIVRHHGIFVFPDTNAHFQGEQPQHLYSVRFTARELWGDAASSRDSVHLDLWDSYLEHA